MPTHTLPHPKTCKAARGRSWRYCSSCGSRWPDPTPCCSDLVIGCLFPWQQSRTTATVKKTESRVTGPMMNPPSTTRTGKNVTVELLYMEAQSVQNEMNESEIINQLINYIKYINIFKLNTWNNTQCYFIILIFIITFYYSYYLALFKF